MDILADSVCTMTVYTPCRMIKINKCKDQYNFLKCSEKVQVIFQVKSLPPSLNCAVDKQ